MVRRSLFAVALELKCCWELVNVRCADVDSSTVVELER